MKKEDYTQQKQYADLRIALGWGELPDLTRDEKDRVNEAMKNLQILTTAQLISLVRFANNSCIPMQAPAPYASRRVDAGQKQPNMVLGLPTRQIRS